MINKKYYIIATTTYADGSVEKTTQGEFEQEKIAKANCELRNREYKEKRKANKLLPKVVWTYIAR